jgi:hypothetical protein
VSKMFDSLRRAESARKQKAAGSEAEPDKPTIGPAPGLEGAPRRVDPLQIQGFPDDFLRELGMLKNSLESAAGAPAEPMRLLLAANCNQSPRADVRGRSTGTVKNAR